MADVSAQPQNDSYYSQVIGHPVVQQAFSAYDWAKQQNTYLSSTLDSVEQRVSGMAETATKKYNETYENYYVRPKEAAYGMYSSSLENGKWALDTGKTAAVHTGTVALGATVLATQLSLQLTVGGAHLILDGAGAATNAGKGVVNSLRQAEQAVEDKIWATITETQRIAKIPMDKAAETTHSFLDILNALVERALNVNIENEPDTSIKDRVRNIAHAVVTSLSNKAHESVLDPAQEKTRGLLEHLSKSFVLVDVVRSKKEWALEKVEELSASVQDLKSRLESEAKQYGARPEEMLMKSIRTRSVALTEQLEALKSKHRQMFGDGTRIETAISYFHNLDSQLGQADDIYQVRDEVLTEARQRLAELTQWTSGLLQRRQEN